MNYQKIFFDEKRCFQFALLIHVMTALFSVGFLHPDEQYYALDFAFGRLFPMGSTIQTWEFESQIRPWSLPFIFYGLGLPFKLLGVTDPFIYSLLFRMVSSLVALFSTFFLLSSLKLKNWLGKNGFWILLTAWPLVLMHARTSSENWSSSLFLIGLGLALKEKRPTVVGLLWLICFYIRFQMGFLVAPALLLYWRKNRQLAYCLMGMIAGLGLMIVLDYWGYGEWVLTPLRYFQVNILEQKVNTFGTSSVAFYLVKTLIKLVPLWGLVICLSLVAGLIELKNNKQTRNLFILIAPYLLVHHLIGHKELRFLYGALPFLLLNVAIFLDRMSMRWTKVILIANFLAYPVLFVPAYRPMIIYQALYDHSEIETLYTASGFNPLEMKSLIRKDLKVVPFKGEANPFYLLTQNWNEFKLWENRDCQVMASSYPFWLIKSNPIQILKRSNIWTLQKCQFRD